jgi:hypothetical protein
MSPVGGETSIAGTLRGRRSRAAWCAVSDRDFLLQKGGQRAARRWPLEAVEQVDVRRRAVVRTGPEGAVSRSDIVAVSLWMRGAHQPVRLDLPSGAPTDALVRRLRPSLALSVR